MSSLHSVVLMEKALVLRLGMAIVMVMTQICEKYDKVVNHTAGRKDINGCSRAGFSFQVEAKFI